MAGDGEHKNFLQGEYPLITVVVPVFNSAGGIARCLSSIVHQTYQNLEILVIYRESSDDTFAEIKKINDDRIRVIEQIIKDGPGGARNIGIDEAKGKYIGFVEADDYIDSDFYMKLYKKSIENDADISISEIKNSKGDICSKHNFDREIFLFSEKYKYIHNAASFNKIFRIEFIKFNNIRFAENLRWEDNPFILKAIYFSNKMCTVKGVYYHYCSSKWTPEYREFLKSCVLPIVDLMVDFAKSRNFSSAEMAILRRGICRSFAGVFLDDRTVYLGLRKRLGFSIWLAYRHYKKRWKQWRYGLFKSERGIVWL